MSVQRRKFLGIEVGDLFSSYKDLKQKIEEVQERTEVALLIRDCITLKGAMRKRPHVAAKANPDLEYHSVHYMCICGRNDTSRRLYFIRNGISPQYLTKEGAKCGAEIKVGLSEDYRMLRIKRINDVHNHKISQKLFNVIMENRRLSALCKSGKTTRRSASSNRAARRGKVPSRNQVSSVTQSHRKKEVELEQDESSKPTVYKVQPKRKHPEDGQHKALMDKRPKIQNVTKDASPPPVKINKRVGFKHLIEEMYKKRGTIYEVFEEGLTPQAIFFQTQDMKRNFTAYPEVFLIDSSYQIPELSMKMYAIMNADGNGECTIISLWFVTRENEKNIIRLLNAFMKHNPDCTHIKVIMSDKEFEFAEAVDSKFPDTAVFTCYYHAVRAFAKEVYTKRDIGFENEEERDLCMRMFKKMALAKDSEQYSVHFNRFKLYAPAELHNYFLHNWHQSKPLWVDYAKSTKAYFINQKRNRFDAVDQILRSVCSNFKSIPQLFHDLLKSICTLKLERQQRALNVLVKGPVITSEFHMAEFQYQNSLTPFAFSFLKSQLQSASKEVFGESRDDDKLIFVDSENKILVVSSTTCDCIFHTVTELPCCHIFATRLHKGLPVYEPLLCNPRWTLQYLRNVHNFSDENSVADSVFSLEEDTFVDSNEDNTEQLEIDIETPFIPSFTPADINEDEEIKSPAFEGCIVDEIVPDFDIDAVKQETNMDSGRAEDSDGDVPNINWVGVLETV